MNFTHTHFIIVLLLKQRSSERASLALACVSSLSLLIIFIFHQLRRQHTHFSSNFTLSHCSRRVWISACAPSHSPAGCTPRLSCAFLPGFYFIIQSGCAIINQHQNRQTKHIVLCARPFFAVDFFESHIFA